MSQPSKWWWGLIPLAILWILATIFTGKSIDSDLGNRSTSALGSAVLNPAFNVVGRDVSVSGTVFSPDEAGKIAGIVDSVWGVRKVLVDARQPDVAKPFNWGASHEGSSVVLTGNVPDPTVRDKIVSAAKAAFSGADVKDEMQYASGAPAGYDAGVQFGLDQLARLSKGAVSLSDTGLGISGTVDTRDAYDGIMAALKALPQGFSLAKSDIAAPAPVAAAVPAPTDPAVSSGAAVASAGASASVTPALAPSSFSFDALKEAGKLTLSGTYPDDDTHGKILDAAKNLFAGDEISDQLKAAAGAPDGFAAAATAGLNALSRLATGSFSLSSTDAKLSGEALYDGAVKSIQDGFAAAIPAGFKAAPAEIAVSAPAPAVDAPNCQSLLNTILSKSKINFDTGKARISSVSSGVLDTIVATINRCPGNAVEISGHTDSSGNEAANVALSEQRAKAVVTYLSDAGVPASRLTAIGLGSSRPIASNDTDEGKALNRRIEFSIK
ncbi:OmpA family protein [Rhizobium sp. BK602]|uniref:OmpA family protein n=1 Tax=Rhizobium sp. BK602 TaxID=2586986 RepID=UPI0016180ADE|nr:OmpA family protein [Rhizobium sp. BK602]MBB3609801.1 OOP family OmpA-OmpF porin [Rhizobium sp. BK602]